MEENSEEMHRAIIAQFVRLVTERYWDIPWDVYAQAFSLDRGDLFPQRFWRSQRFHDDDYPSNVLTYLNNCYNYSRILTLSMIRTIINDMIEKRLINEEYLRERYPLLFAFLQSEEISREVRFIPPAPERIINIENVPDDFYRELIRKINISYQFGLYTCTLILIRKLIENLIIDILRNTFGLQRIELFYDKDHGRFRMLNELIKNFKEYKDIYRTIVRDIDDIIAKLEELRPYVNASAHSIEDELKITKNELDNLNKEINLNYIIASLIKINNFLINRIHSKDNHHNK